MRDLASLSMAHKRDPKDLATHAEYHAALCRIFGHIVAGLSVGKVTEDGMLGSYCPSWLRGCPVCNRCGQVVCEHAHLYDARPISTNTCWTKPGEGDLVPEVEEEDDWPEYELDGGAE